MRVGDFRILATIVAIACVSACGAGAAAQSPGLVAEHFSLELKQSEALARADEAIRSAGLTADAPTAISRGGRKQYITVLIHCIEQGKTTLVDLEVAEIPNPENNAYPLRAFLTSYMKTGKGSPASGGGGFTGEWDAVDGGTHRRMVLTQDGGRVTGTYEGGGTKGTIEGTLSGNVLRFTWKQANGNTGTGKYTLSADGSSFAGAWSYGDDPEKADRPWTGTRIGAPGVPAPAASDGKGFAGEWFTRTYGGYSGKLVIQQDGGRVTGRYEGTGNGSIEGTISGRVLRFTWTESNGNKGTGKFTVSEDGRSFAGAYSYDPDPEKGDRYWNGDREGAKASPPAGGAGGGGGGGADKPAVDPNANANPGAGPRKELPALGPTLSPPGFEDQRPTVAFSGIVLTSAPLRLPSVGADREDLKPDKNAAGKGGEPLKIVRITAIRKANPGRSLDVDPGVLEVDVELSRPTVGECSVDIYVGGYLQTFTDTRTFCDAYCVKSVLNSPTLDQHYQATFGIPDVLPATIRAEVVSYETRQVVDHASATFTAPFPDLFMHSVALWGNEATSTWTSGAAYVTGNVPEDSEVYFHSQWKRDPKYPPFTDGRRNDWVIGRNTHGGVPVNKMSGVEAALHGPPMGSTLLIFTWGPKDYERPSPPGIDFSSAEFHVNVVPLRALDERKVRGYERPNRGYDPNRLVRLR